MKYKYLIIGICSFFLIACQDKPSKEPIQDIVQKEATQQVSLTFTGDLLFEQGLYDHWKDYQFSTYFDQVKPYLKGDFVIGNQEVPIAGKALGVSGVAFSFNAPEEIAQQLPDVGFNVMTLSNNHSYDRGYEGVVQTLNNLNKANITTVGLYANEDDAKQITIIEKNGIRIALLAYTYDTNELIETNHSYVTKSFLNKQQVFDEAHKKMLQQDVEKAKEQADVVIASMHWGNEFTYAINQAQIDAANWLNELGVNIIIGNHPHTLQTMETIKNTKGEETLVFYSLGNFVSSAAMVDRASPDFTNMYEIGGIVNLDIIKDQETDKMQIDNVVLTPIVNHFEHDYQKFALMPFSAYTDNLAQKHYQYEFNSDFNIPWIQKQLDSLFKGKVKMD